MCGKTYPQGDDLKFHIGTLHEGMSMEEAKRQRFSLGPTHPAFERVSNKELDQMQNSTEKSLVGSLTHENELRAPQNLSNEEERKPIL